MNKVIYYPYIHVPESPWFSRVLLYWDSVAAIVPIDYIHEPDLLGSYMRGLVQEQLVEQIIPGMHLFRAENFVKAFVDHIDQLPKIAGIAPRGDFFKSHAKRIVGEKIHMEKLDELGDELVNRHLARRVPGYVLYEVEPRTARDFMAYLAGVLGKIVSKDERFYPMTDDVSHLSAFIPPDSEESALRSILLEGVLPAPCENIEPGRLAEFKAKYADELIRFRCAIEEELSQLSAITDSHTRSQKLEHVVHRLHTDREELVARMEEQNKWPALDFGDICAVIGGGIAATQALLDNDLQFGMPGAVVSIAPAIYNAFKGTQFELDDKPLAYAALAQRQLAGKSS